MERLQSNIWKIQALKEKFYDIFSNSPYIDIFDFYIIVKWAFYLIKWAFYQKCKKKLFILIIVNI